MGVDLRGLDAAWPSSWITLDAPPLSRWVARMPKGVWADPSGDAGT
jgi:hypothetical protein